MLKSGGQGWNLLVLGSRGREVPGHAQAGLARSGGSGGHPHSSWERPSLSGGGDPKLLLNTGASVLLGSHRKHLSAPTARAHVLGMPAPPAGVSPNMDSQEGLWVSPEPHPCAGPGPSQSGGSGGTWASRAVPRGAPCWGAATWRWSPPWLADRARARIPGTAQHVAPWGDGSRSLPSTRAPQPALGPCRQGKAALLGA